MANMFPRWSLHSTVLHIIQLHVLYVVRLRDGCRMRQYASWYTHTRVYLYYIVNVLLDAQIRDRKNT